MLLLLKIKINFQILILVGDIVMKDKTSMAEVEGSCPSFTSGFIVSCRSFNQPAFYLGR